VERAFLNKVFLLSEEGDRNSIQERIEELIHALTALVVAKYGVHHGDIRVIIQDGVAVRWELKIGEQLNHKT